ncbi:hypothetical protein CONPUDRAFT_75918 [Coniophora puteana RWD-64-598 SS2]|uniref:Uncharacterized protein n=1 Tax=Coniophora puteana (strain RWD-64-598) TaxID=741705 RepID=A0A5M3ME90_CONPW|nr:uncharacterized protein CONPUDRAFT_75918 [Coniophora puteana RWD-64-598 SS2]EIW77114.1 hypothetical protein CONPUDRAFT_75918 [Coniophora puteana RWD-64-598 SS2]
MASETANPSQLELMSSKASTLANDITHGRITAKSVIRMDVARSVTWIRLVSSRWLFVASSDTSSSSLTLWDVFSPGSDGTSPLAECFLPGPVETGEVCIHNGEFIVAISVETLHPTTRILSVVTMNEKLLFAEMKAIPGYSHVVLIYDEWVLVALKGNKAIPYAVKWKNGKAFPLSETLDELGTMVKACFWNGHVVMVSPTRIKLFTISSSDDPPTLIAEYPIRNDVECPLPFVDVTILHKVSTLLSLYELSQEEPCELKILVRTGYGAIDQYTLCRDAAKLPPFVITRKWKAEDWPAAHIFSPGLSGRHIMFLYESNFLRGNPDPPSLAILEVSQFMLAQSYSTHGGRAVIPYTDAKPSTWTFPQLAFDDYLGFIVLGNMMGELAIIDLTQTPLAALWAPNQTPIRSLGPSDALLPTHAVALSIFPSPWNRPDDEDSDYDQESETRFSRHRVFPVPQEKVPNGWGTNLSYQVSQFVDDPRGFDHCHALRSLGLFYMGGLYFLWGVEFDEKLGCVVFPVGMDLDQILEHLGENVYGEIDLLEDIGAVWLDGAPSSVSIKARAWRLSECFESKNGRQGWPSTFAFIGAGRQ